MADTWYYIGPDKTGMACNNCCAAFYDSFGSCSIYPCPTPPEVYRNYFCPNPSRPTPDHYYAWDGDPDANVSISVNGSLCPTSSTTCWSYTPSLGLNSAGRIGEGCSQTYVAALDNCSNSFEPCPTPCAECCTQVGAIVTPRYCSTTASGCHCSSDSSRNTCSCVCTYQYTDPDAPCYLSSGGGDTTCTKTCPDGSTLTYICTDPPPECPCGEDVPLPDPPCGSCQITVCVGGAYECSDRSCATPCSAGYYCSCGACQCNTSSTCCSGSKKGWSFNAMTNDCLPCYAGWEGTPPSNCCDATWKQKNCSTDQVCCGDGLCYSKSTVLCDFNPP